MMTARSVEEVQRLVRERSPLAAEETEALIRSRFRTLPRRLAFALGRWPLASARVLDVGCSWGHCLVHFGPGSLGVDNTARAVRFCSALGLEAVELDVDAT